MTALRVFFGTMALSAAYVLASSGHLPPVLASHFGSGGASNGSMPRSSYITLMLALTTLLPCLVVLPLQLIRVVPLSLMRLPNREYWLAPERVEGTLAFLTQRSAWFGCFLALFLAFTHSLVVKANSVTPPHLQEGPLLGGLAVFSIVTVVWAMSFVWHFRVRT